MRLFSDLHNSDLKFSSMFTYGLDVSSANKKKRTGVEWYAYHLIQNMKRQALKENERVFLYAPEKLRDQLGVLPYQWLERVLAWSLSWAWMAGRVSWEMLIRKPDLLFVPAQALPKILGKKTVTTIHDLGFLHRPDLYDQKSVQRLKKTTQDAIKRADHIITVSETTRDDLLASYPIDGNKISVTPLAYDLGVYKTLSIQTTKTVLEELDINHPFFLFVGRLESKKNILILIKAFDQFSQKSDRVFNLILVGIPGFGYEEIKLAIEQSPNRKLIRELGYLDNQKIAALLNATTAFCFPSWFEGFGLPNLEAMACGAPLIISDIPVHREVVQNAGLFVNPDDIDGWAQAMQRLSSNKFLAGQLIERGRERMHDFSWAKTAEQTWGILRNLL